MFSTEGSKLKGTFLVALLFVGNVFLTAQVIQLRRARLDSDSALARQAKDLSRVRTERLGFENALKRIDLSGGIFLTGHDVIGDSIVVLSSMVRGLIYVFDTRCPGSALNLPTLNELAEGPGFQVVAVSFEDDLGHLAKYVRSQSMHFPVLAFPGGLSIDVLPRNETPITVLVNRDRVLSYISGRLDERLIEAFRKQ